MKPFVFRRSARTGIVSALLMLCLAANGCGPGQRQEHRSPEDYIRTYRSDYRTAQDALRQRIGTGVNVDADRYALGLLYAGHGDFEQAQEEFRQSAHPDAAKQLALTLFRGGDFTAALEVFARLKDMDDETRYYYGLTCEKLNLFDKALEAYRLLAAGAFAGKAGARINDIEREVSPLTIADIDPEAARMIAQAPPAQDYPQAGALILLSDEETRVTADDREITTLHYIVKIINERGKEAFAEMPTSYDSTFEKVSLEYARTITPDGRVLEVGSRHIRDVTKYLNFPLYSNARVFIISFPEIAAGATIEYKIRIECNRLINDRDFVTAAFLQAEEPIIDARFTLSVANDKTVALKTVNEAYNDFGARLIPDVDAGKEITVYRWRFANIPQIIPEAAMPPGVEINPGVIASTFKRWQDVYAWWWALAKDKISADAAIKDKVKELIAGAASDEEKARAIYNFCARDIRYVAVEYGQAGYEPHRAADIFKNKYGDCKDQAVLLVTMLAEAGLEAAPVLIGTRDSFDLREDFPATLFNHAIAVVRLNGTSVFLDPTAETCSFGDLPSADQGRRVLVCASDGWRIEQTPLYEPGHNLAKQTTTVTVNPDETIRAARTIVTGGVYQQSQRYWLLYTLPEVVQEQILAKAQDISVGARLAGYKVQNLNTLDKPLGLEYSLQGQEYFTPAGSLRILPQAAGLDTGLVAKEKRRYPIEFAFLDTKVTELNCLLPPGFVIQYVPEAITEDNPWFTFSASYQRGANRLVFVQTMQTKKRTVSQQEYPAFKASLERVAKRLKQRAVFSRKQ